MSETASLLCVGNELTEGKTLDRHGRFLSRVLGELGIKVRRITLIPDERELFLGELRRCIDESRLVIVTGGLGPTSDDLSREVVARAMGVDLVFHGDLWDELLARFPGREVPLANRKQVEIPAGATVLRNPAGTAPGFLADFVNPVDGRSVLIAALPGPPRELSLMVDSELVPLLKRRLVLHDHQITRATAFLIPESELEEVLQAARVGDIEWGTRVEEYRITFVLRGGNAAERQTMLEGVVSRFDSFRIKAGEVDPVMLCAEGLRSTGGVLVTAESCTGGLVAKLVTDLPGSSELFWGATVAYSYEAKRELLGVSVDTLEVHGAVSAEVVEAMALGGLDATRGKASVSVAVSGIAGPGGGTNEKPVGTVWIAVSVRGDVTRVRQFCFFGSRESVRKKSAVAALLMVAESLLEIRAVP